MAHPNIENYHQPGDSMPAEAMTASPDVIRADADVLLGQITLRSAVPPPEIGGSAFETGQHHWVDRVANGLDSVGAVPVLGAVADGLPGELGATARSLALSAAWVRMSYTLSGTGLTGMRILSGMESIEWGRGNKAPRDSGATNNSSELEKGNFNNNAGNIGGAEPQTS